jgi:hypothetical protein
MIQIVNSNIALLTADTTNGPVISGKSLQTDGRYGGSTLEFAIETEALLKENLGSGLLDQVD